MGKSSSLKFFVLIFSVSVILDFAESPLRFFFNRVDVKYMQAINLISKLPWRKQKTLEMTYLNVA